MLGVNKVIVVGTLGKDPEMRQMQNGNQVANISVAVTEKYKDKEGNKQELTEWINVVFSGKVAEIVGEYCHKGSKIYVEGKMKTEKYEKNGQTHYATKVVAAQMQLLGDKSGGQQERSPAKETHSKQKANAYQKQDEAEFDDDIPF